MVLTSQALAAAVKLASLSSELVQPPPLLYRLQSRAIRAGFCVQAVVLVRGSNTRAPRRVALMLGTPSGKASWSYCSVTSAAAKPSKRSLGPTAAPTSAVRSL